MTIVDISVRRANAEDASAISRAHNAAWRNTYSGIIPGPALNRMIARRTGTWWQYVLSNGADIRVLQFAGEVAGYASIRGNLLGNYPAKGEICELYLLPEYQGTGLGRRLFTEAKGASFRRYGKGCIVWALSDNEPACGFYRHMGGRHVARNFDKLGGARLEKSAFLWP